jgi:UDP-GlcNAc:undecaprenyl-phosphate GlcNAc-1-phosphate transferase
MIFPHAAEVAASFVLAFAAAALAIGVLVRRAPSWGLVDAPGGRKRHADATPLVGGLAIFIAALAAVLAAGAPSFPSLLLLASSLVVAVGVWDDAREIRPATKLAAQAVASALLVAAAGIELRSVGDLLGWKPIGLWVLALPMTIFATVGVVNSINMLDGMDGLAGVIALIAFAWYAAIAAGSGLDEELLTATIFCGALAGFLVFNLRLPWQARARAFLGDAGSLLLGFALGAFAIDLTQGPGRTLAPIAALWVLLLPLADCVSLMARRIARGKSPFLADRRHIHHYLEARGLSHGQTVAILAGLSATFGAVGYLAWVLRVPEPLLFWPFFFGFFAYHFWIQRAWRGLDARSAHRADVPSAADPEEPKVAAAN